MLLLQGWVGKVSFVMPELWIRLWWNKVRLAWVQGWTNTIALASRWICLWHSFIKLAAVIKHYSLWMTVIFYFCTVVLIMFALKFTNTDRCSVQKEHHWFKWTALCYGSNELCVVGLILPFCHAYMIFIPLQRTGTNLVGEKNKLLCVCLFNFHLVLICT
jgi:hypothetical protein